MLGDDFIHRIDKFKVSREELDNFVARVSETHRAINALAGCIRDEVLLKTTGDGEYNVSHSCRVARPKLLKRCDYAYERFPRSSWWKTGVACERG